MIDIDKYLELACKKTAVLVVSLAEQQHPNEEDFETLEEYLQQCLCITPHYDAYRNYIGAEILISYGGPTIWIETGENSVLGTYGDSRNRVLLPLETIEKINNYCKKNFMESNRNY